MVKLPENTEELLDVLTKKLSLKGQNPFGGFQNSVEISDYIIYGAPLDDTPSYKPGCGEGPKFIREAASNVETINIFNWRDLEEVKFHDAGDFNWLETQQTVQKVQEIQEIVDSIVNVGKKPITIGGEHTVMVGSRNSFKSHLYVIFDAHADLRSEYQNNPFSHACASRRLLDDGFLEPEQLFQIGIRALCPEEVNFIKKYKIKQILAPKFTKENVKSVVKTINDIGSSYKGIYLSIDTDGFDPSFAPGVGTPEPFGINPYDALTLLNELEVPINGMDINEFNPSQDTGGITSILCAKILLYILTK
ncbi:MAG: agmatinase [Candidatus Hodarchaeales archaeon]|jgi:agmatinase